MRQLEPVYSVPGGEQPGEFPYTRGISATPAPWVMGQYGGFATPEATNQRFRELIDAGLTGLSVALDLPTQLGIDSHHERALGEVGRVGVAIDDLHDVETLFSGLPLERLQVRTTANSMAYFWSAALDAMAQRDGRDANSFGLFIQNDSLKEYIARGTQIFPVDVALKLSVDVIEQAAKTRPNWVPLAISGYHIREAGADAAMEVGFTFANAIAYLDELRRRDVDVRSATSRLYTFLSSNIDLLPEVAKFRAARRAWARLMRERYGVEDGPATQLRIFAFTAGSSLTAQQPLNNVVRASLEAAAAVLGGIQTLHVCAYDEALGVPTIDAATLALRTQQIIALETGLAGTVDPLAGSYAIERLTDEIEEEIVACMQEVDTRGGALECIRSGWMKAQIEDSSYRTARAIEDGTKPVVGVNVHQSGLPSFDVFEVDEHAVNAQVAALQERLERRDHAALATRVDAVRQAAAGGQNVVGDVREALLVGATVGEVTDALRDVYGSWVP